MKTYRKENFRGLSFGKRILVIGILLALFLPSYSYGFAVNGIYYNKIGNGEVEVTSSPSNNKYSGSVVIPAVVSYQGTSYSVTSIGERAFKDCSNLTSETIPNSVTSIGNSAFYNCSGLTSITIGSSVKSIGYDAFYNCSGLTSVTIPNSVTSIGDYAFYGCSGLTSVAIPNSVTSIGDYAFYNCSGLTSVTVGNSVTSIGNSAFYNCSGLTSFTIPNSVTSIGNSAFYNCSGLTSVTIGNSVMSIGNRAFYNCSGLTSFTIPSSVTSIGSYAFYSCRGLTSVTIPNSVTSIGSSAFSECSGLTSLTIPNSVTSIGNSAFEYCYGLTNVTIGRGVNSVGANAFSGCSSLSSVTLLCSSVGSWFKGMKSINQIVLGDNVKSIDKSAFEDCSGLTSVNIHDFSAWFNISFSDHYSNPLYYAHHLYLNGEEIKDLTIPDSVASIGNYAFDGCSGLTSVTIPNGVTSIGDYAFDGCSGLTSVTLLCPIVSSWFKGMTSIREVILGESVTSIVSDAFVGCSGLFVKSLAETPPTLQNEINASKLEVPVNSECKYARADYWNKIDTIYSIQNNRHRYPVLLDVHGERIVSLNGVTEWGVEVDEDQLIEVSATNELAQYGLIMKGGYNITNGIAQNGKYVFYPSNSHHRNMIETYSCPTQVFQLSESGTLINKIGVDNVENILSLKVSGPLNGTDILTIRKMTNLRILDMEDATIIDGGDSYYQNYVTSKDAIGDYFFKEKENLVCIKLPKTVTEIRRNAFDGCKNLVEITIPNSVTSIGDYAFYGCSGLTSVTIGNSVTSIRSWAFTNCSRLTSVNIHDIAAWCKITFHGLDSNPLYYAHHLFLDGEEIKDLVIPNSVMSIGSYAFSSCRGLTSVTIPNSVTSIGSYAFYSCSGLTSVTIPNSVTSIGNSAFLDCGGLTSLTIPNSVTSIDSRAFSECSGLTSVTLLCREVDAWFSGNTSVKEVVFGDGVTSVGDNAFSGCSCLTSVTVGKDVRVISESAFSGCSGLTSLTFLCPNVNAWFSGNTSIKEVVFGDGVTSIGDNAFSGCSGLTSVTIPLSVTSIGSDVFSGCYYLASVKVYVDDMAAFCNNAIIGPINSPVMLLDSGGDVITEYVIPNSVTSIGEYAFRHCSGLTRVTIPESVTSIGDYAFSGCSGLTSATIPNSVTSIGGGVFSYCHGLTSVTIPNSVTFIGRGAFSYCSGLTSVTIPNSVTSIGYETFYNCRGLTSVTIPNSVTSIGGCAFEGCSGLTSVTIPNSVTSIGNYAFSYCSGLTSVTIPNSVMSIGDYAFSGCSGLTSVTIGSGVTSIGDYAFSGCSKLAYLTLLCPNVGTWFQNTTSIKKVTFGSSVQKISNNAFINSKGLTSVTSLNTTPPEIYEKTFSQKTYTSATLFVPIGCKTIYWLHPYWENFTAIEETEDVSGKKDLAIMKYQEAMSVWNSFLSFYYGDGKTLYNTAISKQSENNSVADELLSSIERLKNQLSESNISGDDKESFNSTLDGIGNAVNALKMENENDYHIGYFDLVQSNYELFNNYYNRLLQYKERIENANTNEELESVIEEIDVDAAGMKDNYLNPIIDDYSEMVEIYQRFTEIGNELRNYQQQLDAIATEIESSLIGIEPVILSDDDVTGIYDTNGKELPAMQPGINIVRYSDGTTRKVVVR